MATRDPTKRRKIRALEAAKDQHREKKERAALELKKIGAELRSLRARR